MMTDSLTPELALRYLSELSPSVRGAAVLAADGTVLAGELLVEDEGTGRVRVQGQSEQATVVASIEPGPLAELARADAAAAAVAVRVRC